MCVCECVCVCVCLKRVGFMAIALHRELIQETSKFVYHMVDVDAGSTVEVRFLWAKLMPKVGVVLPYVFFPLFLYVCIYGWLHGHCFKTRAYPGTVKISPSAGRTVQVRFLGQKRCPSCDMFLWLASLNREFTQEASKVACSSQLG